jgi:hypothetical protein
MVWALMQSIGEVTTMFPIAGGFIEASSFKSWLWSRMLTKVKHAGRFVDPAFSFSMAWMYYFMWSVFLGSGEIVNSVSIPTSLISIHRMERCYPHSSILGARGQNANVGMGPHLLGTLLGPLHLRYCGLWRAGVLPRMVQDLLPCCLFLHLIPGQCWCLWQWLHWISVLDASPR